MKVEDVRLEPRELDGVKVCALVEFNCVRPLYARGICRNHYQQLNHRGYLGDLNWYMAPKPECSFPGCKNESATRRVPGFCYGHQSQRYRGVELHPIRPHNMFSEKGRVCKSCEEDKPLTEYYIRNKTSYSTKCKACYIEEVQTRDAAGRRSH